MESSLENVGSKHVPRSYQDITIQMQQSVRKTKAHLFADVLHHELQLSGVFTLTVEQVSPQSRRQHTVIGQDSLQAPTHVFTCMKLLLTSYLQLMFADMSQLCDPIRIQTLDRS